MPTYQQLGPIVFAQLTSANRDAQWPVPPPNLVVHNLTTGHIQVYLDGIWVNLTIESDLHGPVTLSDDSDPALTLSGQELTLSPALGDHLADAVDAHDASAISNVPAGSVAAATVQAAIDELATDYAAADSSHAGAADPHAGYVLESLLDAKGDLIAASAADTPAKVTVGANSKVLMADSAATPGVAWTALNKAIVIHINGGGSVLTTGVKLYLPVPITMTITGWDLVADQSGSIVIDVWKDTYANFPPTVADTIAGSEKPTLSSVQKNQDTSLSTWTTAITAGDVLGFNIDSVTSCTWITLTLRCTAP